VVTADCKKFVRKNAIETSNARAYMDMSVDLLLLTSLERTFTRQNSFVVVLEVHSLVTCVSVKYLCIRRVLILVSCDYYSILANKI
jgi:hypothetical protein